MGGKSNDSPDYKGAAEAQGQSSIDAINAQTKANRPNQYTPWGSSTWNEGGTAFDSAAYLKANPKLAAYQKTHPNFNPEQHYNRMGKGEGRASGQADTYGQGEGWSQNISLDPATQRALDDQQAIQEGRSGIAKGMLGSAGQEMQTPEGFWEGLPNAGQPPPVNAVDSSMGGLGRKGQAPSQGQYSPEDIQRGVGGAEYDPDFAKTQLDRQMSLAQPQMDRQVARLETQLRNQGLSPGSEAYDNAISDMRNQQGEMTGRMQQDAMRLGADEQQRQFGRNVTQGQFGNQASQQALMQQLGIGGQQFSEGLAGGQFAEQQRAARAAESGQQYRQDMQGNQQQFAQGSQQFNMQNQARQQQVAEQLQREGWSLNKINAMMSGQQVQNPQMPNFQGAGAAAPTNYLGAAQSQGQYDLQQQQNAMAPWMALGQIGGGMAGGMMGG